MKLIKKIVSPLICWGLLITAEEPNQILPERLIINEVLSTNQFENSTQQSHFNFVLSSLSQNTQEKNEFYHLLKNIKVDSGLIYNDVKLILKDGSTWMIDTWYNKDAAEWKPDDRLKISYHDSLNSICFENIDKDSTVWGSFLTLPTHGTKIDKILPDSKDSKLSYTVTLSNGTIFNAKYSTFISEWTKKDNIFVFHKLDKYKLWNIETNQILIFDLLKTNDPVNGNSDILKLEHNLNKRVLAQPEATHAVSNVLINYAAGLNNPNAPIGVFLFMGPSGTGKTELAKAVALEYYQDPNNFIRLDMSHFHTEYTIERLIGSPPGYVNHEDGGQLTNAIMDKPESIVLLDEIEKAHPAVLKAFLPILDEGYITDSQNRKISCTKNIFIMTSNICAQKIASLFELGYEPDEILKEIESDLMDELSPELYNRMTPILFRPLTKDIMGSLVNLMLKDVIHRAKKTHNIKLIVDDTAKEYLAEYGFHPQLGARPLKKLIEKTVTSTLAYAIVTGEARKGSTVVISYDVNTDSWHASGT